MEGEGSREEARRFLAAFLDQMRVSDQTSRASLQIQVQILNQLQADSRQRSIISQQLDGVAQRLDLVDHGLRALAVVLEGEDVDPQPQPQQPRPQVRSRSMSAGQILGQGFDTFIRGRSGGRG